MNGLKDWLLLAAGGVAGTYARFALTAYSQRLLGKTFPYGTLGINLLGCFLIGLFVSVQEEKMMLSSSWRAFLIIGFCGAFTTFSAFALDSYQLFRQQSLAVSCLNILASVCGGLLCLVAGIKAAHIFYQLS